MDTNCHSAISKYILHLLSSWVAQQQNDSAPEIPYNPKLNCFYHISYSCDNSDAQELYDLYFRRLIKGEHGVY